jgi:hypothetical protein
VLGMVQPPHFASATRKNHLTMVIPKAVIDLLLGMTERSTTALAWNFPSVQITTSLEPLHIVSSAKTNTGSLFPCELISTMRFRGLDMVLDSEPGPSDQLPSEPGLSEGFMVFSSHCMVLASDSQDPRAWVSIKPKERLIGTLIQLCDGADIQAPSIPVQMVQTVIPQFFLLGRWYRHTSAPMSEIDIRLSADVGIWGKRDQQ